MGRCCGSYKPRRGVARVAGIALMVTGGLIFLIFVPRWLWKSALGICLISVGWLMWRFGE